jgi:hypothetical protein
VARTESHMGLLQPSAPAAACSAGVSSAHEPLSLAGVAPPAGSTAARPACSAVRNPRARTSLVDQQSAPSATATAAAPDPSGGAAPAGASVHDSFAPSWGPFQQLPAAPPPPPPPLRPNERRPMHLVPGRHLVIVVQLQGVRRVAGVGEVNRGLAREVAVAQQLDAHDGAAERLATGGGVIKRPPPSARAHRYIYDHNCD